MEGFGCDVLFEINEMLPSYESPRHTEEYEGFYHLVHMSGNVEKARLEYILRDHSAEGFEERNKTLKHITKVISEKIKPHFHLIESAEAATKNGEILQLKGHGIIISTGEKQKLFY